MTKQEILTLFEGMEIQAGDKIVLIQRGKAYSLGEQVNVTLAELKEAMHLEAQYA